MKRFNQLEQTAFNQLHPRIKFTSYQLVYGKQVLFGPADYPLCMHYKKIYLPTVKNK